MATNASETMNIKLCIVGNNCIGKRTLKHAWIHEGTDSNADHIESWYDSMCLGYHGIKQVKLNNKDVNVAVWILINTNQWNYNFPLCVDNATFILFTFDLTDMQSLRSLEFLHLVLI